MAPKKQDPERAAEAPTWNTRLLLEDGGYLGGSDMRQVAALRSEVGGEGAFQELVRAAFGQALWQGGHTSYVLATGRDGSGTPLSVSPVAAILNPLRNVSAGTSPSDAADTETAVGCAQLGRLAIGGFIVLRNDFIITSVLVRKQWRRHGIGTRLVNELLHRLPREGRDKAWQEYNAWAFTDSASGASFLEAAGGELRGNIWQVFLRDPLPALALLISSFAPVQLLAGAQIFRFPGLGELTEYRSEGRLQRTESEVAQLPKA